MFEINVFELILSLSPIRSFQNPVFQVLAFTIWIKRFIPNLYLSYSTQFICDILVFHLYYLFRYSIQLLLYHQFTCSIYITSSYSFLLFLALLNEEFVLTLGIMPLGHVCSYYLYNLMFWFILPQRIETYIVFQFAITLH